MSNAAGLRKTDPSAAQNQFVLPRGFFGRIAGWWMSRDNARLNRIAVELLSVRNGDRVLEIGFGPGQAIELLVQQNSVTLIAGVDPSGVMVEQARSKNEQAVLSGRVLLFPGVVEQLPFPAATFSKVFAVSNFHTWRSREQGLAEIRRVLVEDGLLLICLRKAATWPGLFSKPGVSSAELAADMALLMSQEFQQVETVEQNVGQGVVCLLGQR